MIMGNIYIFIVIEFQVELWIPAHQSQFIIFMFDTPLDISQGAVHKLQNCGAYVSQMIILLHKGGGGLGVGTFAD